jgi:hypothetical protein
MYFNDLLKLRDIEVKEILKNNNHLSAGKYGIFPNSLSIVKIVGNDKHNNRIYFKQNDYISFCDCKQIFPLSFDKYKELKNSKYLTGKIKITPKFFENFVRSRLSSLFNEDRYDIEVLEYSSYSQIKIKIYYPEIEITNSLETKHKIRDLYLTFIFTIEEASVYLAHIDLFRTKFTPIEVYGRYVHSHYSGSPGDSTQTGTMCFGKTSLGNLVKESTEFFNMRNFVPLIIELENYLKWESIDGVPHRKLNELKKFLIRPKSLGYSVDKDKIIDDLYNYTINKISHFNYEFITKENGEFNIEISDNHFKSIENILIDYIKLNREDYNKLLGRKIDGDYGEIDLININLLKREYRMPSGVIKFKDISIPVEVIEDNDNITIDSIDDMYPKSLHPDILIGVINRIQDKFLTYFIKQKL